MANHQTDVLILGAGAAGLAAASILASHGKSVQIIEARNRIGGRVFTHRDPIGGFPIEYGAEFIHGTPPDSIDIIQSGRLTQYDVLNTHLLTTGNGLKATESYWERIQSVLEKLDEHRAPDRSFADFLKAHASVFDPTAQDLVLGFVEGFHAAIASDISEQGLASSEQVTEVGSSDASEVFRIAEGYDHFISVLAARIPSLERSLKLNRVAKRIRWSRNCVEVEARSSLTNSLETYRAQHLIVTLPIGVLQDAPDAIGGVVFEPKPASLSAALKYIRMGSATRITLRFTDRFWEGLVDEPIGYLHAPANSLFPVWWSPMPARRSLMTAWAGGTKSIQLSKLSNDELAEAAIESLCLALQADSKTVREKLLSVVYHNWTEDPFCRGAYSYIAVEGKEAAQQFAMPVEDTLYFAGEAAQMGEERGTVSGALATGYKAARHILKQR